MAVNLRDAWRHVGGALVGPLVVVAVTGLLELLVYNADPRAAGERLGTEDTFFGIVRSLHLWSSRALLAGAAVHTAWVWHERRTTGRHRRAYMSGTLLFGILALGHLTGHVLRWDALGRDIVAYEEALLPSFAAPYLADGQLPLHVALLGGVALLVSLLHFGIVGRGPALGVDAATPRRAAPWRATMVLILAAVLALALLLPAPTSQSGAAWPMGPFRWIAMRTGPSAFGLSAFGVLAALGSVPWIETWRPLARTVKIAIVAVFVATFLPF